jgi:hypothetical protein
VAVQVQLIPRVSAGGRRKGGACRGFKFFSEVVESRLCGALVGSDPKAHRISFLTVDMPWAEPPSLKIGEIVKKYYTGFSRLCQSFLQNSE